MGDDREIRLLWFQLGYEGASADDFRRLCRRDGNDQYDSDNSARFALRQDGARHMIMLHPGRQGRRRRARRHHHHRVEPEVTIHQARRVDVAPHGTTNDEGLVAAVDIDDVFSVRSDGSMRRARRGRQQQQQIRSAAHASVEVTPNGRCRDDGGYSAAFSDTSSDGASTLRTDYTAKRKAARRARRGRPPHRSSNHRHANNNIGNAVGDNDGSDDSDTMTATSSHFMSSCDDDDDDRRILLLGATGDGGNLDGTLLPHHRFGHVSRCDPEVASRRAVLVQTRVPGLVVVPPTSTSRAVDCQIPATPMTDENATSSLPVSAASRVVADSEWAHHSPSTSMRASAAPSPVKLDGAEILDRSWRGNVRNDVTTTSTLQQCIGNGLCGAVLVPLPLRASAAVSSDAKSSSMAGDASRLTCHVLLVGGAVVTEGALVAHTSPLVISPHAAGVLRLTVDIDLDQRSVCLFPPPPRSTVGSSNRRGTVEVGVDSSALALSSSDVRSPKHDSVVVAQAMQVASLEGNNSTKHVVVDGHTSTVEPIQETIQGERFSVVSANNAADTTDVATRKRCESALRRWGHCCAEATLITGEAGDDAPVTWLLTYGGTGGLVAVVDGMHACITPGAPVEPACVAIRPLGPAPGDKNCTHRLGVMRTPVIAARATASTYPSPTRFDGCVSRCFATACTVPLQCEKHVAVASSPRRRPSLPLFDSIRHSLGVDDHSSVAYSSSSSSSSLLGGILLGGQDGRGHPITAPGGSIDAWVLTLVSAGHARRTLLRRDHHHDDFSNSHRRENLGVAGAPFAHNDVFFRRDGVEPPTIPPDCAAIVVAFRIPPIGFPPCPRYGHSAAVVTAATPNECRLVVVGGVASRAGHVDGNSGHIVDVVSVAAIKGDIGSSAYVLADAYELAVGTGAWREIIVPDEYSNLARRAFAVLLPGPPNSTRVTLVGGHDSATLLPSEVWGGAASPLGHGSRPAPLDVLEWDVINDRWAKLDALAVFEPATDEAISSPSSTTHYDDRRHDITTGLRTHDGVASSTIAMGAACRLVGALPVGDCPLELATAQPQPSSSAVFALGGLRIDARLPLARRQSAVVGGRETEADVWQRHVYDHNLPCNVICDDASVTLRTLAAVWLRDTKKYV